MMEKKYSITQENILPVVMFFCLIKDMRVRRFVSNVDIM